MSREQAEELLEERAVTAALTEELIGAINRLNELGEGFGHIVGVKFNVRTPDQVRADTLALIKQHRSITADARQAIRAGVLAEVEAERAHQDRKWGGPAHDRQHSAVEFLHFIRRYVIKADDLLSASQRPIDWPEVRRRFVQIAALSVAALENVIPLTSARTADAQPGDDSAEADGLAASVARLWNYAQDFGTEHCADIRAVLFALQPADSAPPAEPRGEYCPGCHGAGEDWCGDGTKCARCNGSGVVDAPPAEPSIAELASHRWRIGDMFCRPECSKVRLVYALDDALALVKYIREDGVLDQCNAAILASWVQASGCALGNLFDKLRTLDSIEQQLSDLAAKVEALSKPQQWEVPIQAGYIKYEIPPLTDEQVAKVVAAIEQYQGRTLTQPASPQQAQEGADAK